MEPNGPLCPAGSALTGEPRAPELQSPGPIHVAPFEAASLPRPFRSYGRGRGGSRAQEHALPPADVTPAPISGPEAVSSAERRVLSPKQSWEGSQSQKRVSFKNTLLFLSLVEWSGFRVFGFCRRFTVKKRRRHARCVHAASGFPEACWGGKA